MLFLSATITPVRSIDVSNRERACAAVRARRWDRGRAEQPGVAWHIDILLIRNYHDDVRTPSNFSACLISDVLSRIPPGSSRSGDR